MPRRGRLIVVSGPSGVGKTSVVQGLAERLPFWFSVSMTTRDPRPGEVDGVDYVFVSEDDFERAVASGELVEWAEYGGHLYGTPAVPLEEARRSGRDVLLDIELVGSRNIKERYPDALMIFVAPPSTAELERRLRLRGDTSEEDIAARLAVAAEQIEAAPDVFDHVIRNDDLMTAISQAADILIPAPDPPGDPT